MTTTSEIRAFVIENFLFGDTSATLTEDMSLIENDLIDSTGILELVAYLEEHFGIAIADAEIVPANLDSISAIATYVDHKAV